MGLSCADKFEENVVTIVWFKRLAGLYQADVDSYIFTLII